MRARDVLVPLGAAAAILLGWWLLRPAPGPPDVPRTPAPPPQTRAKPVPPEPPPPPALPEAPPAPAPAPAPPPPPEPAPPPPPDPDDLRDWVVRGTVTAKDGTPVAGA